MGAICGDIHVTPVWGGKANLVGLEVDGPAGPIEGLSLRLYNPRSGQWSTNYSNSHYGTMDGAPTYGSFSGGRGEFYGTDTLDGRARFWCASSSGPKAAIQFISSNPILRTAAGRGRRTGSRSITRLP